MLTQQSQALREADLVARLQAGQEAAFEALLARYQQRIYRLARHLTRNREDAEEVVQDTFLSAYRKIRGFKGRAALGTWLYRIATNSALMLLRRRRPEPHLSIEEELPRFTGDGGHARPVADWSDRPDDPLLGQELRQVLQEAIAALPPIYKAVVVLRDIEGLSNQQAAEVLGTTVLAVKSRLHRAHLALRERLGSYIERGTEDPGILWPLRPRTSGLRIYPRGEGSIRAKAPFPRLERGGNVLSPDEGRGQSPGGLLPGSWWNQKEGGA